MKHPLVFVAFILLVGIIVIIPIAVFASAPIFNEWSLPVGSSGPVNITTGNNGNLWFVEQENNSVSEITTCGAITNYVMPHTATGSTWSLPTNVTSGPDGNMWFSEATVPDLGSITPAGTVTEYPMSNTEVSLPDSIQAGPDGNLWFTGFESNNIGVMSTKGVLLHTYPVSGNPEGMSMGPNGNFWYAEQTADMVGEINPSNGSVVATYPVPFSPFFTAKGPDGDVWVTGQSNEIVKINPNTGASTTYNIPSAGGEIPQIVAGPDGNMWFSMPYYPGIGSISPNTGAVQEYTAPSQVWDLTIGPDNNIWYTVFNNESKVGVADMGFSGSKVSWTGTNCTSGSSGSSGSSSSSSSSGSGSSSSSSGSSGSSSSSGSNTCSDCPNTPSCEHSTSGCSVLAPGQTKNLTPSTAPIVSTSTLSNGMILDTRSDGTTSVTVPSTLNISTQNYIVPSKQVLYVDGQLGNAIADSGSIVKGNGVIDNLTVNKGAYLAPGHSPGCITDNDLSMFGVYDVQIGGTSSCKNYDQVIAKGPVNLTGQLNVSFINGFQPKVGQNFTIINNRGRGRVSGAFDNLPEGSIFIVDNTPMAITYHGNGGNDVVLTALVKDAYLTALSNNKSNINKSAKSSSLTSFIKRNATKILIVLVTAFIIVVGIILFILKTNYRNPKPPITTTPIAPTPTVPTPTPPSL